MVETMRKHLHEDDYTRYAKQLMLEYDIAHVYDSMDMIAEFPFCVAAPILCSLYIYTIVNKYEVNIKLKGPQ